MKIKLLCIGKNKDSSWLDAMENYSKRINQYIQFSVDYIPDVKTGKKNIPEQIKKDEAKKILSRVKKEETVILLDEKGKAFTSSAFAKTIEQQQNQSIKSLVFIVGGAYGFSKEILAAYPTKMRLSDMTFSHQMIRLFFCEQLYRAFTIIHNHPYHNS